MKKENTFNLLQWSKESLDYWFALAEIYDSYGLPTDLIFIKCCEEKKLPQVFQKTTDEAGNEFMRPRPVTAEEFEGGIQFCTRVRQSGGLDALMEHLSNLPEKSLPAPHVQ